MKLNKVKSKIIIALLAISSIANSAELMVAWSLQPAISNFEWVYNPPIESLYTYKVYRDSVLIADVGSSSFYTDVGLRNSTTYNYSVSQCSTKGCTTPIQGSLGVGRTRDVDESLNSKRTSCLFRWAETYYPELFSPTTATVKVVQYNTRYYAQTNTYLAISMNKVLYQGPLSNDLIAYIGTTDQWYRESNCI